jgi:hypothetical protein
MDLLVLRYHKQQSIVVIVRYRSDLFSHYVDDFLDDKVEKERNVSLEEKVIVYLQDALTGFGLLLIAYQQ